MIKTITISEKESHLYDESAREKRALSTGMERDQEYKVTEYIDNSDRVEAERAFSLAKRSYGLGCIRTKLADTTRCSVAPGVMAMNIAELVSLLLCRFLKSVISRCKWCWMIFYKENLMTPVY